MINGMRLKHINTVLLVAILLVNGYVIAAPFIPGLLFHWASRGGAEQHYLANKIQSAAQSPTVAPTSQPNQVIIPSMLLDQPIYDGPVRNQYKILDQGIWRWPNASTPDKGGNTVLIGHRFTYTQPRGVFYYLNKVKLGDEAAVWWGNRQYRYKVTSINEVLPTDTAIEANTPDSRLTLFTCTPLWLPKHRLVVVAELENGS